jgi:ABC-type transport system involved in multi-copper enzyme maturation permease subunit
MNTTLVILRKELRDAVHSRWLLAFSATFAIVALALAMVQERGDVGVQGFDRTTASLVNLCLLLVPLLTLVVGAGAIAGERDRGTLTTLRAQPLSSNELLLGKYFGLAIAVWLAVGLGFGIAGLLIGLVSPVTGIGHYMLFVALSGALAMGTLSIGMLISVISEGRARALAIAVLTWFVFVIFYDLAAMGFALLVTGSGESLLAVTLGNPVESVRILAVLSLDPELQVLGPLGAYLYETFGTTGSTFVLLGGVLLWTVVPLTAAAMIFRRQDA